MIARLRKRLSHEGGYTLTELLVVMVILGLITSALTILFVSGIRAQRFAVDRLIAQQEARTAVDRLRREVHCASTVAVDTTGDDQVTLDFPQVNGTDICGYGASVVWTTEVISGPPTRYRLVRNGVQVADFLRRGDNLFSATPPSTEKLGSLVVQLPVNARPGEPLGNWDLESEIILRNSQRTTT